MMLEQKTKWDEGTRKCVNGLGGLQIEKIPTVTKYISNSGELVFCGFVTNYQKFSDLNYTDVFT